MATDSCCCGCFSAENRNGNDDDLSPLKQMVDELSETLINDLISQIEDGLKEIDITKDQQVVPARQDPSTSPQFGHQLLSYVETKCVNIRICKVCFLRKLSNETRNIVKGVFEELHKVRLVGAGLSVVEYLLEEMKQPSRNRSAYTVRFLLYMFCLLKYIKDQNLEREKLYDVLHFIVKGSFMCLFQMQSRDIFRFPGFSVSLDSGDIQNLEFQLGCTYTDLASGNIFNEVPTVVPQLREQESVDADAVGIENARDEVIGLLNMEGNPITKITVLLYGPGGIGKTTLATAAFNRVKLKGYHVSRVNLGFNCSENDIMFLQQQILHDLFGKNTELRSCVEGEAHILNAFREEVIGPVFIFIDNFETESHLAKLLPGKVWHLPIQMRVLITTRNLHECNLFVNAEIKRHKMKQLGDPEAKNLLCKKALGSADANFGRYVNIQGLLRICGGIPLALTMVASYMRHKGDHVSACIEILDAINRSSGTQAADISNLLVDFLYKKLEEPYKEAFLDVASFFNNWKCHIVAYIFAGIQFKVLENFGLITVSHEGILNVHGVVRDWASMFCKSDTITDLQSMTDALKYKQTKLAEIKRIWLSEGESEFQLEAGYLDKMHSLRVLYLGKLIKVKGTSNGSFENMRFFYIYNKHCLPMDLNNLKRVAFFHGTLKNDVNFVELTKYLNLLESVGFSDLTGLSRALQLSRSLHFLDLSGSSDLIRLPEGFTALSSLEELDLTKCINLNLKDPPDSFSKLKLLKHLNLRGCSAITALPENFGDLSSLEELNFTDCVNLESLPNSFGQLMNLCRLHLRGCSVLASLPDNFGNLSCLEELDLGYCHKLATLPGSFGQLKSLCLLHLRGCSELASLPESCSDLYFLEELDITDGVRLVSLEINFKQLNSLRCLHLKGCSNLTSLPQSFASRSSLEELDLTNCAKLKGSPANFSQFKSLRVLKLCCSQLSGLPESFGDMSSLQQLTLTDCNKLVTLPVNFCELKSLSHLHLKASSKLIELPGGFDNLSSLQELDLTDCGKLKKLPDNFELLPSLRVVKLQGCSELAKLPGMFGKLSSLEELLLTECNSLDGLPSNFSQLKSLRHLRLRGASVLTIESLNVPSSLETLDLCYFSSLQRLPQRFVHHHSTSLKMLFLDWCSMLSHLPDEFGELNSLKYLSIAGCRRLQTLPVGFVNLTSLEGLEVSRCYGLEGATIDMLVKMRSLMFVDMRVSPLLMKQWKSLKEEHPSFLGWFWTDPEAMYAETIISALRRLNCRSMPTMPNTLPKTLAVLLTMDDIKSSPYQRALQIVENKQKELREKSSELMWVDVRGSLEDSSSMAPDNKTRQVLGYAVLGWLKLRHPKRPKVFATLETLHTLIVTLDVSADEERKTCIGNLKVIAPGMEDEDCNEVDLQALTDPHGGFRRIFSPLVLSLSGKSR